MWRAIVLLTVAAPTFAIAKFGILRCLIAVFAYVTCVKLRQMLLRLMHRSLSKEAGIRAAAAAIHRSGSVCVFTGAGISVESGIPDFRSPGGLWSRYNPMLYCEYSTFLRRPDLFWQMARALVLDTHKTLGGTEEELLDGGALRTARPNAAHAAVAEMESCGWVHRVVTQNVDGLHQEAGSKDVIEVHGTMATCSCVDTGKQVGQDEILKQWGEHRRAQQQQRQRQQHGSTLDLTEDRWVPKHPETGGVLKSDVTFFGEALPTGAFWAGAKAVLASSAVLVVGTSLHVMPAGILPSLMRFRLGTVIVVNLDESGADGASLHIQGAAGEVVPKILAELKLLNSGCSAR